MTTENKKRFTVISNIDKAESIEPKPKIDNSYHSNPMYQKLLNFRNLQEQQKKRFTVEDLLKW